MCCPCGSCPWSGSDYAIRREGWRLSPTFRDAAVRSEGPPRRTSPADGADQQLDRHRDAAELGSQHRRVEQDLGDERQRLIPDPEALTNGVGQRVLADRGGATEHLGDEDDAEGAEREHPQEMVFEIAARLGAGRNGAGIEEASDAGDDPERDLERVLHRLDVIEVAYKKEAT